MSRYRETHERVTDRGVSAALGYIDKTLDNANATPGSLWSSWEVSELLRDIRHMLLPRPDLWARVGYTIGGCAVVVILVGLGVLVGVAL